MMVTLTWAKRGDVVSIVNEIAQKSEPIMVLSPCGAPVRSYRCVTCQQQLANIGQVILHTENGGSHHLVTWCSRHGRWEAAEPSQVAAFNQLLLETSSADR